MRNRMFAVVAAFFSFSMVQAQQIEVNFDDGLYPSAHGWTFVGRGGPTQESQVATVSNGILRFNTTPFGGNCEAFWEQPATYDPNNYGMEFRMRATYPTNSRSCYSGGLLGVQVGSLPSSNYLIVSALTSSQLYILGIQSAPCPNQSFIPTDGANFHTYKIEVKNGRGTVSIDGVQQADGALATLIPPAPTRAFFGDNTTSGGNEIAEFDYVRFYSVVRELSVLIDVKPGSVPNAVNLNSKGNVPVAIFSGGPDDVDAGKVDVSSLRLSGAGALRSAPEDVNGDGRPDLVAHFDTRQLQLAASDTTTTLTGKLVDGTPIKGMDYVVIVGK